MADIGDLRLKATIDTTQYETGAQRIREANKSIRSSAEGTADSASAAGKKTVNANEQVSESARKTGSAFKASWAVIAGIASNVASRAMNLITSSVGKAVDRADQLHNFPVIMKNLGYSAVDASKSVRKLSDGIDGLPTSLNSMTGMVTQLAPLTKNLDEATNLSLAFNNALLAGGKSVQAQENAMTQYQQMLAAGKVDMQAWTSLLDAMPGQLNQLAVALLGAGHNQQDLYKAMKSGKISFDDFNNAVMRLNKEGTAGFASFEQQARGSTQGIGTALENVQNRIAKVGASIIDAIGVDNISNAINRVSSQFSKLGDGFSSLITLIVKGDFTGKFAQAFHVEEDSPVVDAILRIRKAIIDLGPHIVKLGQQIKQLFTSKVPWAKLLPPGNIAIAIEKVTQKLGWFLDHAGPILTAYAAFKLPSTLTNGFNSFTKVGGKVVDTLLKVTDAFESVKGVGGLFNKLKEVASGLEIVKAAQAAFNTVMDIAKGIQMAYNAALAANPIGTIIVVVIAAIAAITAIVKALQWFFTQTKIGKAIWSALSKFFSDCWNGIKNTFNAIWPPIRDFFVNVWNGIKDTAQNVWNGLSSFFSTCWNGVKDTWNNVWNAVGNFLGPIWDNIKQSVSDAVTAIQNFFKPLTDFFSYIWNDIKDIVITIIQTVVTVVGLIFQKIAQVATDIFNRLRDFFVNVWNGIKDTVTNVVNAIRDTVTNVLNAIRDWWTRVWGQIRDFISPIWNAIRNTVQNAINAVSNVINNVLNAIRGVWNNVWNGISNFMRPIWDGITNGVRNAINTIGHVVGTIKDKIMGAFRGAGQWLHDVGGNIIQGLIHGIEGAFDWLRDTIKNMCGNIVNFAKRLLGINSPSRVMRDTVGISIPEGIAVGVRRKQPLVLNAVGRLVDNTVLQARQVFQPNNPVAEPVRRSEVNGAGGSVRTATVNAPISVYTNDPSAAGRAAADMINFYYV